MRARALLIDCDGTLYTDAGAIPGAVETLVALREQGVPFRLVTNTTRRSRRQLLQRLQGYGFEVHLEEVFTAVRAGVELLRSLGLTRIAPFLAPRALEDFQDFQLSGGTAGRGGAGLPEAVVVGDLGSQWTPALLNEAFRYVLDGALLLALQRDRYWLGPTGLELDAGAYVAAIEYATGHEARVCGKPDAAFYRAALKGMLDPEPDVRDSTNVGGSGGAPPQTADSERRAAPQPAGSDAHALQPVMIGDDLWADVAGAQRAGLQGWLVRTGKFREDVLAASGVTPERVLESIADLTRAGSGMGG